MKLWPTRAIKSIVKVIPRAKQGSSGNSIVWNLNLDQIEPHEGRVLEKVFISADKLGPSTFAFEPGTVLYSKLRPYLNKVVVADEAGFGTTELVPLRCDPDEVYPEYLAYFLRSEEFLRFATEVVAGAKMPRMVMNEFWNYKIPIPPIAEQRRIVAILDQAGRLRVKRREALASLDNLTQSVFMEMFGDALSNPKGWVFSSLGELCKLQGGLQVTTARKNFPIEVPYLRVANVYRGQLNLKEIKTIRVTGAEISRTLLEKGDLLIVEGHGNPQEVGRSALWNGEIVNCTHQNHLIRVRFDSSKILPVFACEYLNSPTGRRHLTSAGKTTSGLNTINASNVRGTPIFVPPLALQYEFEKTFNAIKNLAVSHQLAVREFDGLFASLHYRAFRGEL